MFYIMYTGTTLFKNILQHLRYYNAIAMISESHAEFSKVTTPWYSMYLMFYIIQITI